MTRPHPTVPIDFDAVLAYMEERAKREPLVGFYEGLPRSRRHEQETS